MKTNPRDGTATGPRLNPALDALKRLRKANAGLARRLEGAGALVFQLPVLRDWTADGPSDHRADEPVWPITAKPVHGDQAVTLAQEILKKTHRPAAQNPRSTDRLPGILWTADPQVLAAAADVNACRRALKDAVTGLGLDPKARQNLFSGTDLEHVHLVECYRQVVVLTDEERPAKDQPPSRRLDTVREVAFGWSVNLRVVDRISVAKAIAWIENMTIDGGPTRWTRRLQALGVKYVARVRDVPPVPVANIKRDSGWAERLTVPLPIIFVGPVQPKIQNLKECADPKGSPSRRKLAKLVESPIIEELGLYQYQS